MNFFINIYKSWSFKSTLENNNRKIIYIYTRRFNSEVENSDFLVRHIDVDLEYHAILCTIRCVSLFFFARGKVLNDSMDFHYEYS